MATKIRGITIELGADTSGIEKGLKDVNKDLKATQNELKDVDKLLKLDPKNTELLRQKQELLGKAIGQTKDKLETLRKAEKEAEDQFKQGKISEDQYRAIKREVAETETNLRNLGKQADTANKKLSNVPETMNKIADKAKTAAQKTRGISLAAAGVLTALGAGVLNTVRNADDINTISKQSGISTDRIQEYRYAADLIDVSADAIISANTKLKKNMASGGAAFDKLGVKVTDANGELRDSSEVFDEVVLALSKIQNETERDTVAMEIFGKGADELAGLIDDGGAAFRELTKEAHEAGAVLSQDSLAALNKTNDALDKLKAKGTAALGQVAEKLINNPKFDDFLNKTTEFLDKFIGAIAEMPLEKIETLVGILAGTAAISPLATLIGNVAGAIGKVSKALGGSGLSGLTSAISGSGGLTEALFGIEHLLIMRKPDTGDVIPENVDPELRDDITARMRDGIFANTTMRPGTLSGETITKAGNESPAAYMGGGRTYDTDVTVNVTYTGDASKIGQALEPVVTVEKTRKGPALTQNTLLGW